MFSFSNIYHLKTSRPLFCNVPRLTNISQNPTLPKPNNKKVMLNKLIHFIIKNLITRIYSPHNCFMHKKTYERHVVQLIMENTIIITVEKGMSYSETNNVPYHKNQLCTIPYAPTMYHTLYTNDVAYHIH